MSWPSWQSTASESREPGRGGVTGERGGGLSWTLYRACEVTPVLILKGWKKGHSDGCESSWKQEFQIIGDLQIQAVSQT